MSAGLEEAILHWSAKLWTVFEYVENRAPTDTFIISFSYCVKLNQHAKHANARGLVACSQKIVEKQML